jgi:NDP-sugar pyrophosphorylase family protein
MRLVFDHILVTERVQAVNGVEIVDEIIGVNLYIGKGGTREGCV